MGNFVSTFVNYCSMGYSSLNGMFYNAAPVTPITANCYSDASSSPNSLARVIYAMNHRDTKLGAELGNYIGSQLWQTHASRSNSVADETFRCLLNKWIKKPNVQFEKRQEGPKQEEDEEGSRESSPTESKRLEPLTRIFPYNNNTVNVVYLGFDAGEGDIAVLYRLLSDPRVKIKGVVASLGNMVVQQAAKRALQALTLAQRQHIKVYPGAIVPLGFEDNPTILKEMQSPCFSPEIKGVTWPEETLPLQKTPGYLFVAELIASGGEPITVLTTAPLTDLSKTLAKLEEMDRSAGRLAGSFAKNIRVISMVGGSFECLHENAESNFAFDPLAAQQVFSTCQKYKIPIMLAPMDLTHRPDYMLTWSEALLLGEMQNPLAQQIASITQAHLTEIFEPIGDRWNIDTFVGGFESSKLLRGVDPSEYNKMADRLMNYEHTYSKLYEKALLPFITQMEWLQKQIGLPMEDLHATAFLSPNLYKMYRLAVTIGKKGHVIINTDAHDSQKNVYALEMNAKNAAHFYKEIFAGYENYKENSDEGEDSPSVMLAMAVASLVILGGILCGRGIYKKYKQIEKEKKQL